MQKRVLIIDDLDFILEFEEKILNMLAKESGIKIEIDVANTVFDAQEKLAEFEYDLLVVDMNLPDGNGVEIAKFALQQNEMVKIAALTIYPHKYEEHRAYFDLFLKKPILPRVYKESVAALLKI